MNWAQNWVPCLQHNPDLVEIVESWQHLPTKIRDAMLAIVRTTNVDR